ncbi:MAG TPA: Ig-like domain-containing protein [Gemmatimonadaceae bacterium]|nr:Ig-like domain-containing protein [Gemmatimonadaceae bacterium]
MQAFEMIGVRGTRLLHRALSACLLLAATSCLDDSPVASGAPVVRATLSANVVGAQAGGTVQIRVGYRTRTQQLVTLPSTPVRVSLAAGTTVVLPLTVDIGPCLGDAERAPVGEAGCKLVIEVSLLDATGGTVDTQTRESSGGPVSAGQSVNFGTVTVGITVSAIVVAPTAVSANPQDDRVLTATVRDAAGAPVSTSVVSWTTSDATVAQLLATTGASITMRALKIGTASVSASAGGKTTTVPISVTAPAPLVLRQRQGAGCVIVGQTLTMEVDSPPGPVTWSSASPAIASIVGSTGVVTGVANGSAIVTATSGTRTGNATVCVTGPLRVTPATIALVAGRTTQLSITGNTGGTVSAASANPAIATVDAVGLVRGVGIGSTTVSLTLTAPSGTDVVQIPVSVAPSSVSISPSPGSAALNRSTRFTASALDANGSPLPAVPVAWTITDATVGSLSASSGVTVDVRALKLGTTTVRATVQGVSAAVQFTGTPVLPASRLEKVSGDGSTCPTRSTSCSFVVRAVDANGSSVPGTQVAWQSAIGCGQAVVIVTDAVGLSTAPNLCSSAKPGPYTQVATLQANQQTASFGYTLRGLLVSLQSADSTGLPTYAVTSPIGPATGLAVAIEYVSGPTDGYVTTSQLNVTTTPAVLRISFDPYSLPYGAYRFNIVVSTTTPGIGPGVETVTFDTSNYGFVGGNRTRATVAPVPRSPQP